MPGSGAHPPPLVLLHAHPDCRRLQRDDIPVCNCVAPVGLSISSRRAALEQQQTQRLQQQAAAAAAAAATGVQDAVQPPALAAAGALPPLPMPTAMQQHAAPPPLPLPLPLPSNGSVAAAPSALRAQQTASPDGGSSAAPAAAGGGSAKKRVRRTDWEGRKCDWCGVTETSNWRRHPENRDMLLCNQCGGYVRKHGKLSEERRERVAAQQVAAAIASVASLAPPPLGHAAGPLPLFQPAGVLPPLPPPPMPLPEQRTVPAEPLGFSVAQLQRQFGVQPQPQEESAVEAAMAAVGNLTAGMQDCASPLSEPRTAGQCGEPAGAGAPMDLDPAPQQASAEATQVDASPEDAEAASAAATVVAAVFAPWSEELATLREQRLAVSRLVAAVFAPFFAQSEQQGLQAAEAPAAPKQEPVELPAAQHAQHPSAQAQPKPLAVASLTMPAAPAVAAAQAAPSRSSGGLRRAAAAAAANAGTPQVGCGDSCLNRWAQGCWTLVCMSKLLSSAKCCPHPRCTAACCPAAPINPAP